MFKVLVNEHTELTTVQHSDIDHCHERYEFRYRDPDIKVIEISFLNKSSDDTKIDSNGNIIEDMAVIIDQIMIDHADLTNKLDKISVYIDQTGRRHRTYNWMSFNGTYRIKVHHNLLYTEWLASHL